MVKCEDQGIRNQYGCRCGETHGHFLQLDRTCCPGKAWIYLISSRRKLQEWTLLLCQEVRFPHILKPSIRELIRTRKVSLAKSSKRPNGFLNTAEVWTEDAVQSKKHSMGLCLVLHPYLIQRSSDCDLCYVHGLPHLRGEVGIRFGGKGRKDRF